MPERMPSRRAIQSSGFEEGFIDAHDAGHQENCSISEPHKPIDERKDSSDPPHVVNEGNVSSEELVDRSDTREEHQEEHTEGTGHDEVRHVGNCLEELRAF